MLSLKFLVRSDNKFNPEFLKEYLAYRKTYTGNFAFKFAQVKVRFEELRQLGLVRLHADPEEDYYDSSDWIDEDTHLSKRGKERLKRKLDLKIEREGYWIYSGQYRIRKSDKWQYADNIGGIIGDDLQGYEFGLMESAIDQYEKELEDQAELLSNRVTFAGI